MEHKVAHDSETPAHGQQVFTASAFIHRLNNDVREVFLAKRAQTKKFFPGVYEMLGGHIDFGENMRTGLQREVLEEVGRTVAIGDPYNVFDYTNNIKGSHSIEISYFAVFTDSEDALQIHPEDHETAAWMTEEGVRGLQDISPEERAACLKGFELLRGEHFDTGEVQAEV